MEDNKLYSINSMKNMEVIEMNSGARLGYIRDIKIDYDNKKIISIILPFIYFYILSNTKCLQSKAQFSLIYLSTLA